LRTQRQIVQEIQSRKGASYFNHQFDSELYWWAGFRDSPYKYRRLPDGRRVRELSTEAGIVLQYETPPGPERLRQWLGDDVLATVGTVRFELSEPDPRGILHAGMFRTIPDVKVVQLSGAGITDERALALSKLKKLQYIELDETSVTSEGLSHLRHANKLEGLSLSHVSDATLSSLHQLRQLQAFSLGSSQVTSAATYPQLRHLPRLQSLAIVACPNLNDKGFDAVGTLTDLREFNLYRTSITDHALAHVHSLSKLRRLLLCEVPIQGEGLQHLEGLANLNEIFLNESQVTDEGWDIYPRFPHSSRYPSSERKSAMQD
jgi:hypothetical protein